MKPRQQVILRVGQADVVFNDDERDIALSAALGAALTEAQVLEFSIAHLLGFVESNGGENFEDISSGFLERTLGLLAKKLKRHTGDPSLAGKLDEIVAKRNFVVHRVLRKYQWPLMSDSDYLNAIKELDEIRNLLKDAELEVTRAINAAKGLGIIAVGVNPQTGLPKIIL